MKKGSFVVLSVAVAMLAFTWPTLNQNQAAKKTDASKNNTQQSQNSTPSSGQPAKPVVESKTIQINRVSRAVSADNETQTESEEESSENEIQAPQMPALPKLPKTTVSQITGLPSSVLNPNYNNQIPGTGAGNYKTNFPSSKEILGTSGVVSLANDSEVLDLQKKINEVLLMNDKLKGSYKSEAIQAQQVADQAKIHQKILQDIQKTRIKQVAPKNPAEDATEMIKQEKIRLIREQTEKAKKMLEKAQDEENSQSGSFQSDTIVDGSDSDEVKTKPAVAPVRN